MLNSKDRYISSKIISNYPQSDALILESASGLGSIKQFLETM